MKNNFWFIVACVLVFFVGYNMNDTALSLSKYKVAVIDVPEILSHSSEMQALKREQDKSLEELNVLISKAQNELLNEKDRTKILQKEAQYRKQIAAKKESIDKQFGDKIAKINDNIRIVIDKEARKSNYNLVLPTGMVISGGEDITDSVIKKMK
ncbi:MAG: OmpH family outer membrane protein [Cyanobacteria bacterium SIG26]|nr:OmpH family outer membrane protein [Cyanobacteria bacterium SIG26]